MPFSHHSHSGQFCAHAKNTAEEMVQAAISRGMTRFALTEHMPRDAEDLYPEEIEAGQTAEGLVALMDGFYAEAVRLRDAHASRIPILVGFESEWIRAPSSAAMVRDLLSRHRFDFFVGSVHHVHTVPIDFDRAMYERARARSGSGGSDGLDSDAALFADYFDAQHDMLTALRPPVVGHFDLIRLFSDDPGRSFRQWPSVWRRIERNLQLVAAYGGLLELNSSAFRKGMAEPYPGREICEKFLSLGGRFTLSDDSHSTDQVGLNYHRLLDHVRAVGIRTLYYVERAPPGAASQGPEDLRVSSVTLEELEAHSFWKQSH